jgi:hypothetical protein
MGMCAYIDSPGILFLGLGSPKLPYSLHDPHEKLTFLFAEKPLKLQSTAMLPKL